jgi:hypothetical protein
MNNNSVPVMPEVSARVRARALMTVLLAGALSACSGGGGSGGSGGTPAPAPALSADQKIYEDAALHGGIGSVGYDMPYGGGVLAAGTNFLYSVVNVLPNSPLSSGAQTATPAFATLDPSLAVPTQQKSWFVAGGQIVARSATANLQVTYSGSSVQVAEYADDNQTVVATFNEDGFREVPLTGLASSAPVELLAILPLDQWAAAGNFSASTPWQAGSFYLARKETLVNDRTVLEACYPAADLSPASTAAKEQPCITGGTLASLFPLTLYPASSAHPRETFVATDGTVATVQGLQVWMANQPEPGGLYPGSAYRVFVQQGGAIYTGVVQHQGTALTSTLTDGSVVDETFALNAAALATVGQGVITSPVTAGLTTGVLRNLKTLDLIGIGGTAVNGALSPQDLRTHYNVPAGLDGTGQTIAVVDAPGPSNVNYFDDLKAYSQAFGLPICAASAGSCLTHIDLSNGSFAGTGNGPAPEATLDIEMAHAIAPGANIVLVTAASSNLVDLMAAVNYAASLPQVSIVSASWGYDYAANANTITTEEPRLAQFVAQGKVFFASSGDAGQFPGNGPSYPAISAYFTSVGGTRIHSVSADTGSLADTSWIFSGGGPSPWMPMPSWQSAFVGAAQNSANLGERAVPDVVAVADPLHSPVALYFKQRWTLDGGTSVSSPVWAGIAALLAQQLAADGSALSARVAATPGGFNGLLYRSSLFAGSNPALQALAGGASFSQGLTCATCSAGPGYNDAAGLGTPDVASLVAGF